MNKQSEEYKAGYKEGMEDYHNENKWNSRYRFETIQESRESLKKEILEAIDEEIEIYKEIGEMLQGESKTINIEKIHMAGIIRSKISNIK